VAAGVASAWRMSLAEVGMVHGTVPFVWMTLMPGSGAGIVPARLSLVPLRDLFEMGPLGIVGNLLVFAALGFFAPMRFAALASLPRILALAAGCSILIEVAQYVLQLDRVSSVDDVLLNAVGAVPAAPGVAPLVAHPPDPARQIGRSIRRPAVTTTATSTPTSTEPPRQNTTPAHATPTASAPIPR
jgi:hypothetical protein